MLPLALDLTGRDVLVLGMGRMGAHKARQLLETGARVHVISDQLLVEVPEGVVSTQVRRYRRGDPFCGRRATYRRPGIADPCRSGGP